MSKFNWKSLTPHIIAIAVFLIIAIFYCLPALQGKVLQQSDLIHWKGMAANSFQYKETHGHFPLWTNSPFGGMPAFQIAMDSTNPLSFGYLHSLFTLFLPAPISYFFLMCLSFYFLSQVMKVDYRIGILGAIAYAYASFTPIIVFVGHVTQVQTLGYLPALLGAVFLVFQKKYWIGGALSAVFASMMIGMNHPQVTYYFLIIAICASIAYAVQWIKNREIKHLLVSVAVLAFAGIVGVTTNMVNLATTYDFSKATMRNGTLNLDTSGNATRQSSGLPIDYAFQWSYGKAETLSLLIPNIYGGASGGGTLDANSHLAKDAVSKGIPEDQAEPFAQQFPTYWGSQPFTSGPVYLGAVICFLFLFGLFYYKGFDKWWILAACTLAILMCWGKNFPAFNNFLFNYLPMYNKFRVPTMTLIIPQVLFPLLSMLAIQQFIYNNKDKAFAYKKLKQAGIAMTGILAIAAMLYGNLDYKGENDAQVINYFNQATQGNKDVTNSFYNALKEDRQSMFGRDLIRSLFFAAAAFLILWLSLKQKIKPVYATVGLLLLSSIDVIAEGRRYLNSDSFQYQDTIDESASAPTQVDLQIMKDTGYYRVLNLTTDVFSDAITCYHHNSIGGYSPAKLSVMEDLLNFQLRKEPMNLQVLNMLNTKYVIVPGQQNQPAVQQNPEALGPCWFVKAIDFKKGPAESMKALTQFNPKDTAIVEDAFKNNISLMPVADSTASISLIKNDNDIITYKSSSKTNQFAVFSEIYYDRGGWKATIDNKESPIIKTDYALRGLVVPAGNHEIRFEFKPASYYDSIKIAIIGSALGWLVMIGALVQAWRKRKKLTVV